MRDNLLIAASAATALMFTFLFIGVGLDADNYQYFLSRRVPKVLAIIIAAVAIAQSSLVFQTVTHNRILTPSLLGFDYLYLLIQVLFVFALGGIGSAMLNTSLNFAISIVVMIGLSLMMFSLYFKQENPNILTLMLLGVVVGQLLANVANFIVLLLDPTDFAFFQGSMFASFNNVNSDLVYVSLLPLSFVIVALFLYARKLDVFWLDKDNAISLGVDVKKVTKHVLILISILISISTALVGPILFFGLLVANVTRQCMNSYHHKDLMIFGAFISIAMLLGGQWIIENLFSFETTISVIINFVGGIYFLSLLIRQKV